MRPMLISPMVIPAMGLLSLTNVVEGQIKNDPGHSWIVRYHKEEAHQTGDIAFRLEVTDKSGKELTATLTRYNGTKGSGANEKYSPNTTPGGKIELKGRITKDEDGGKDRRKENFELSQVYFDKGEARVVTVQGYYHTGKKKQDDRTDDRLCVRIRDNPLFGSSGARFRSGEPCDEQPPDEDVLLDEETGAGDPTYDP